MKNKINISKQIGVFMDHSGATLLTPDSIQEKIISSGIAHPIRTDGEGGDGTQLGNYRSTNNETHKHNKEQNQLHVYFKNLVEHLKPFDEILILGPTTARDEFHNYFQKEKLLHEKMIVIEKSNYLSENQLREKIINFFKSN